MSQAEQIKKLIIASLFATFAGGLILLSDYLIKSYFPNRPILDDVAFRLLPHLPWLAKWADGVVVFGIMLVVLLSRFKLNRVTNVLFAFAVMGSIRAVLNLVTPIGDPTGDVEIYGFLERYPLVGMFPSGHTASLVLSRFLAEGWGLNRKWITLFEILIVAEIFALLTTHGHYTIDIVGGVVLGIFAAKKALKFA